MILNIAAINAYNIFMGNSQTAVRRWEFPRELWLKLVEDHIYYSKTNSYFRKITISQHLMNDLENVIMKIPFKDAHCATNQNIVIHHFPRNMMCSFTFIVLLIIRWMDVQTMRNDKCEWTHLKRGVYPCFSTIIESIDIRFLLYFHQLLHYDILWSVEEQFSLS